MQRVGIFSGTFDPFHRGHLEACLVSKSVCSLKTVLILIEKKPRQKAKVTSFKHRVEVIDRSTQEYPGLQLVDVGEDNVNLKNTLAVLLNRFPDNEYWYIVGSDTAKQLMNWPGHEHIFHNFHMCIVQRTQNERSEIQHLVSKIQNESPQTKCEILPPVWSELSSSKVRSEIARSGVSDNVMPEALTYIKQQKLYEASTSEK